MDKPKILIVEDYASLADKLGFYCETESMDPIVAYTGSEALAAFYDNEDIDLVVLDINLPDTNGFELCRIMRDQRNTPILFMTGRDSALDEVSGLEMGADGYVKKPVEPRVMVAHIRMVLKRTLEQGVIPQKENKRGPKLHPDFTVDNDAKIITYRGKPLKLTASEFIILLMMIREPKRVFSLEQIIAMAGEDILILPNSIAKRIRRIRNKLMGINPNCNLLVSVRGLGYKLMK